MTRRPSRRSSPAAPPPEPAPRRSALPGGSTIPAIFLLIVAHALFFRVVLFEGKSFLSPDTLQAAAPAHRYAVAYHSQHGAWPRWIPHVFSGMPARGSMLLAAEYPLHAPFRAVFGDGYGGDEAKIVHHILASVWTFLLLRTWGLSPAASVLGGLGFSLSTGLISVTAADHGGKLYATSYLPLVLLIGTVLLRRPTFLATALGGLTIGLMLRARHPQIAYYGLLALGLLAACAAPGLMRKGMRAHGVRVAAGIAVLLAIGYLISAPLSIPAQEYAPESIRGAGPGGGLDYEYATQWSFHPAECATFLVPGFFGFGGSTYWGHMPFTDAPNYGGVVIAVLALVGAVAAIRTAKVRFLLVMMAFALLVSMGKHFPLLYNLFFHHLPQFNRFRVPVLILVLFQIGLCALAGIGLDAAVSARGARAKRWGWCMVCLAAAVLILGLIGSGLAGAASRPGEERLPVQTRSALAGERAAMARDDGIRSALFVGIPGALLLIVAYRNPDRRGMAGVLAAGLALAGVADVWSVSARLVHPAHRKADLDRALAPTAAEQWLAEQPGPFRVLPLGDRANSNRMMAFGIESVMGYYPAKLARYATLLESGALQSLPVLRMLGTRYVLSPSRLQSDLATPVRSFGSEHVYALPGPLPRAWFVPRWVIDKGDGVISRIADPGFLPESLAVLEADPSIEITGRGSVESIRRLLPERLEVDVNVERDAVLVVSEVFYRRGWRARVDDRPVRVFPVNLVLSGVALPKGSRRVEFYYESQAETRSAAFELAGWLGLAGLVAGALLRREIRVPPLRRGGGSHSA